jgi:hypothetical protein
LAAAKRMYAFKGRFGAAAAAAAAADAADAGAFVDAARCIMRGSAADTRARERREFIAGYGGVAGGLSAAILLCARFCRGGAAAALPQLVELFKLKWAAPQRRSECSTVSRFHTRDKPSISAGAISFSIMVKAVVKKAPAARGARVAAKPAKKAAAKVKPAPKKTLAKKAPKKAEKAAAAPTKSASASALASASASSSAAAPKKSAAAAAAAAAAAEM